MVSIASFSVPERHLIYTHAFFRALPWLESVKQGRTKYIIAVSRECPFSHGVVKKKFLRKFACENMTPSLHITSLVAMHDHCMTHQ
jgi:hypothetical protein